ncbi:DUF791-domain-containing protein [Xylariomycetidae sp. FL0641]|nr:DUF791-domain-containing protein [Xylariomycetidae sp. FL0641]
MDYYQACLCGLLVVCTGLLASQPTRRKMIQKDAERKQVSRDDEHPERYWYKAYALVMGADWLQGPYLYSLYRDEHNLAPGVVSSLFMTGFVASGVGGVFVGAAADRYGRKLACMVFCLLYALSCFLTVVPALPALYAGRVLGGLSTSILFSVFDSWMVTNFRERKLVDDGCDLSRTYATTATVNSLTAIVSGVASEVVVRVTGSKKAPFLLSAALLWAALQMIWSHWIENYGSDDSKDAPKGGPKDASGSSDSPSVWTILKQPSILALVLASTMFEGSMYLFVFFWAPALKTAQKGSGELPYGVIFASFMASAMGASLIFNIVMHRRIMSYSRLLVGVLLFANFSFVKLTGPKTEVATFWLFCLFEACVGLYWPCTGYLKGRLVEDNARAKVYSIMRVPLNIFVVVAMALAGDTNNFTKVFSTCSILLTTSFAAMWAAMMKENMP